MVILFIIAETIAISHYAWSSSYTRAKIFVVSSSISGGLSGAVRNSLHLFELPRENRELTERIAQLEAQVDIYASRIDDSIDQSEIIFEDPEYSYVVGRVVSNSINKSDNFIVVNKGISDGVREQMALITPKGEMLGYVAGCTDRYSASLSILSNGFRTSGKLLGGLNYGSIKWSGKDRYKVSMENLSKYEVINLGDTVISTGFSNIFPGGVTIGTVSAFELNEMQTAYNVEIELAARITAIDYVLLVGNRESGEIEDLIESAESKY